MPFNASAPFFIAIIVSAFKLAVSMAFTYNTQASVSQRIHHERLRWVRGGETHLCFQRKPRPCYSIQFTLECLFLT
jgi:hypothetical protein